MKITDICFALVTGLAVSLVATDFLMKLQGGSSTPYLALLLIFLPLIAVAFLWLASLLGRKFLFVFQGVKFLLVGAFTTVIDLKIFEFLVALPLAVLSLGSLASKSISFLISTILKYVGNKHWTFASHQEQESEPGPLMSRVFYRVGIESKYHRSDLHREILQFFAITLVGLGIDVVVFFYLTRVAGPQFQMPFDAWIKLSVILAAVAASVWKFLGYKFFVFKK